MHPPPPVYTTGAMPGLYPGSGRKRTVPADATTHARTASGRTTGAIYGKQRSVHAFSPFLQVPVYYTVCAPPPSTVMFHKNHTVPVGILHLSIHAAAG